MGARSFLQRFEPGIAVLALFVCGRPAAGAVVFHKVADTATTVPGGDQPFSWFGSPSLDDRGDLVFWGSSGSHEGALFACRDGSLTVVADPTVPIPGRDTTFRYGFRSFGASIDDKFAAVLIDRTCDNVGRDETGASPNGSVGHFHKFLDLPPFPLKQQGGVGLEIAQPSVLALTNAGCSVLRLE